MPHEIAKLLLEHATAPLDDVAESERLERQIAKRAEVVKTALAMGMPLHEIEAYLEWLDMLRSANVVLREEQDPPRNSQPES